MDTYEPDPMEYVRAALANALAEGLSLEDVCIVAEHAQTTPDFDHAVNTLVQTTAAKISISN